MIVVWRVTESCNLTCPFCAFDGSLKRPRREADWEQALSFGRTLSEYARETGDFVLVSWLGGEPLIWAPLKKLTEIFRKELGLAVSTTTNGSSLLSGEMRAHLLENYAELTVSVDGIGEKHDAMRGWSGGYEKIRKGVRLLVEEKRQAGYGPKLRANVVLMRDSFADFEPLCLELATWGIETITFNQLGGRDRPEFYPEHRLLPEQANLLGEVLPRLQDRLAVLGVHLQGGPEYLRRIKATARDECLAVKECFPGKNFLFIDESGLAAPCSFTALECGVPISEINSVEAFLTLSDHFGRTLGQKLPEACSDCHSNQVFDKFVGER
ncbi:MAG: radical SAM protein [Syntrophobacteraceae bacterium]